MPAAVAVPAIVGAVASVYGAKKASDASQEAAKVQVASATKAQGFNQQVYEDQKRLMAPYITGGNESFARLMQQHWGGSLPQGYAPTQGAAAGQGMIPRPQPPMSLAGMQAQGAPRPPQGGQMAQMRAPTGEVSSVPLHLVAQFEAKGARRIG